MLPIDVICSAVQECDAKPMLWKTLADIKKKITSVLQNAIDVFVERYHG